MPPESNEDLLMTVPSAVQKMPLQEDKGPPTLTDATYLCVSFDDSRRELQSLIPSQTSVAPSALRAGRFGGNRNNPQFAYSPLNTTDIKCLSGIERDTISNKYTMKLYDEYMTKGALKHVKKIRSKEQKKHEQILPSDKNKCSTSSKSMKGGQDERSVGGTSYESKHSKSSRLSKSVISKGESAPSTGGSSSLISENEFVNGPIMCQYSTLSFMLHTWKHRHWARIGISSIAIFKTESDYLEWRSSTNPKLIKKRIDLDTVAALKQESSCKGVRILKFRLDRIQSSTKRRNKENVYVTFCLANLVILLVSCICDFFQNSDIRSN